MTPILKILPPTLHPTVLLLLTPFLIIFRSLSLQLQPQSFVLSLQDRILLVIRGQDVVKFLDLSFFERLKVKCHLFQVLLISIQSILQLTLILETLQSSDLKITHLSLLNLQRSHLSLQFTCFSLQNPILVSHRSYALR